MNNLFPERLRISREQKGWSQTQLADKTGFQPSAISHFENGRRSPSFENLKRLADALSVTIDYLLGRVEEPKGSGPVVDKLFRDFGQLSAEDQETIANFTAMLANKKQQGDK